MKEECSNCKQMKAENAQLRRSLVDNNKNYVEVVNENLRIRRELEGKAGGRFKLGYPTRDLASP